MQKRVKTKILTVLLLAFLVFSVVAVLTPQFNIGVETAKATTIFSDSFDDGTFDAWTGTSGNPEVADNVVKHGSYSAEFNTTEYCHKTLSSSQAVLYHGFYIRSTELPDLNSEELALAMGYAGGTSIYQVTIRYYTAPELCWSFSYRDGASWTTVNVEATITIDTWYWVELYWKLGATDGEVHLYIDEVNVLNVTEKDTNDYGNCDTIRNGAPSLNLGGEAFTLYEDRVIAADTPIGIPPSEGALEPEIIGFSTATNGTSCTFRVKWNTTGSHFIYGTNNTESWVNETIQACTNEWTNATKTLHVDPDVVVQWQVWINDTNGDWTSIPIQNLTTVSVYSMGAVTGSSSDIQTAVNTVNTNGGGNVYVPYGNFSWSAGDTVTFTGANDINIIGHSRAGCKGHSDDWEKYTATTIIHSNDAPPMSNRMFKFGGQGHNPLVYGSVKVSNIQFEATPPSSTVYENDPSCAVYLQQIPDFRVSYCTFINFCEKSICASANDGDNKDANISCYGLIDHCYITLPYKTTTPSPGSNWYWGYGVHVVGEGHLFTDDDPWWDGTQTDYWGKYGYRRWFTIAYIEDCHIEYARHHISSMGRGYYVARFNLLDKPACGYQAAAIDVHGADFPGGRGGEYYNNTIIGASQNQKPWSPYEDTDSIAAGLRGGHNLVYDNTFWVDEYNQYNYFLLLQNDERVDFEYQYTNYTYIWDNSYTNSSFLTNNDPATIRENIEYFLREPSMGQDGFDYIPYAYPHPLTGEEGENIVSLNQPSQSKMLDYLNVKFNYTAIFYQGSIVNSSLWVNVSATWQRVGWNTTAITSGTMHTINYTFSVETTYIWNIQVFNSTTSHFASSNQTFTIQIPFNVWQMTFNHLDLDSNVVDSEITSELYNASELLDYTEGEYTLYDGTYTLKTYYLTKKINETNLATATYGNTTINILLQMKAISTGYISFNNTITDITINSQTATNLTFTATGSEAYQITIKVDDNATSITKDGAPKTYGTDWLYDPTNNIIKINSTLSVWTLIFLGDGGTHFLFETGGRLGFQIGINKTVILQITSGALNSTTTAIRLSSTDGYFYFTALTDTQITISYVGVDQVYVSGDLNNAHRLIGSGSSITVDTGNNVRISWHFLPWSLVDNYFMLGVGLTGIIMLIAGPTWFARTFVKHGLDTDTIEHLGYGMLLMIMGFGFVVVWLWPG